jgi:hypothetical protein
MKIDFKKWLKKESWTGITRHIKRWFLRLPKWLLVKHGHALDVVAVVLVILFAFLLIIKVLYFEPSGTFVAPTSKKILSTNSINQIIVWIEEREVESERGLEVPGGLFKSK